MAIPSDPYRTLGLSPGASLNEIRSAYRRLAKQFHPDTAGERALPRFLAIQAAYERLVDAEGRLRTDGGAGTPGRGSTPGAGRRGPDPWRADPARARATRDAWRARRASQGQGGGGSEAGAPGAEEAPPGAAAGRRSGTGAGEGARPAGARPSGPAGGPGGGPGGGHDQAPPQDRRRGPRKASPGSTTYDEAAEGPRDPEWDGSAWYGPTSRTYWTINPREYADPRKHGPEYQARARRAAAGDEDVVEGEPGDEPASRADRPVHGASPAAAETSSGGAGAWRWNGAGRTTTEGGEAEWGTRAWTYDAGARARGGGDAAWTPGRSGRPRSSAWDAEGVEAPPPLPDLEALARRASPASLRSLAARPGVPWRLLVALLGWPPIGFAAGSLISTLTGCASLSAACTEPLPLLPLAAQPVVVAALFAVPAAAAAAAFAMLAALAVALPVAAVLSVGSVPESRVGATLFAVIVAAAWAAALLGAVLVARRPTAGSRGRPSDDRRGPVR